MVGLLPKIIEIINLGYYSAPDLGMSSNGI